MIVNLFLILLGVLGIYFILMSRLVNELPNHQQWTSLISFTLGLLVAVPIFIPAPDFFGPEYRFTVSMGQMLFALDLVPVLLFLGIPSVMMQPLLRWNRLGHWIRKPLLTGIVSLTILFIWFIPFFFAAASTNFAVWVLKQVLFIISGLIFWWPVAGPLPTWRPKYPVQIIYLLMVRGPMAAIGFLFTFAEKLIYPSRSFALEICAPSSLSDQQAGGAIIWTVGGIILLIAFMLVIYRWLAVEEAKESKNSIGP